MSRKSSRRKQKPTSPKIDGFQPAAVTVYHCTDHRGSSKRLIVRNEPHQIDAGEVAAALVVFGKQLQHESEDGA